MVKKDTRASRGRGHAPKNPAADRRRKRQSRRRWIGLGLLLVIAAWAALYFLPILTVRNVVVEGTVHADEQQITQASGVDSENNMFHVDTVEVAENVAGTPWVKKVTVNKRWPQSLKIEVAEHRAVGVLNPKDNPALVDEQGKVFLHAPPPEDAVEFTETTPGDAAALQAAAKTVVDLPEALLKNLVAVEAPSAESLNLIFELPAVEEKGEPVVKQVFIGSAENLSEKEEAIRVVLQRPEETWNVSNPALVTTRD